MSRLLLLGAILLTACEKAPLTNTVSDNPNFEVAKLFTHEGCTVYRFRDVGREHYFARCADGAVTETSRTRNCGKTCRRQVTETDVVAVKVRSGNAGSRGPAGATPQ